MSAGAFQIIRFGVPLLQAAHQGMSWDGRGAACGTASGDR
jgi:hypothetical protein